MVVEAEVVGDGVVVVVVFEVVFLVIGVEKGDEGVAVLVALLSWPRCLEQWVRAVAWCCVLAHGVFILIFLFSLLLLILLLVGRCADGTGGWQGPSTHQ